MTTLYINKTTNKIFFLDELNLDITENTVSEKAKASWLLFIFTYTTQYVVRDQSLSNDKLLKNSVQVMMTIIFIYVKNLSSKIDIKNVFQVIMWRFGENGSLERVLPSQTLPTLHLSHVAVTEINLL